MPGERTPWKVPMMPDADIVALSGSVSNHWSRKSAALIVISWMKASLSRRGSSAKLRPSARQRQPLARVDAALVGRHGGQDRLHEPRHLRHRGAVLVVGLGVAERPAAQLANGAGVVVRAPQVVAVERGERAVERQDLEAVAGQLQLADDLGPKQRHHVGGDAEAEAGDDLLGDGRAAEHVAALEHDHAHAGAGEVRGRDQAVVPAADHDRVVALRHARARLPGTGAAGHRKLAR